MTCARSTFTLLACLALVSVGLGLPAQDKTTTHKVRPTRPPNASTNYTHLVPVEMHEARRNAAAAAGMTANGDVQANLRHRRNNYAPAATPVGIPTASVAIILRWDTTETGGADLDSLLMDPIGCIVTSKGGNTACGHDYSWAEIGGSIVPLYVTPHGGSTTTYTDPTPDSTSSTSPAGAEVIYIDAPDSSGPYNHMVYQSGSYDGFLYATTAEVDLWINNDVNWPELSQSWIVTNVESYSTCNGRFWNTFSITFGFQVDDDTITSITTTTIDTITTDPYTFCGSTSFQSFETNSRTGIGNPGC